MQGEFRIGGFTIQPRISTISKEGIEIVVEPKVMDLLVYLARHAGEVVEKERIIRDVWAGVFVTDGVLSTAVWKLRHIFADDPKKPCFVETIQKKGYRLRAPVCFAGRSDAVVHWSHLCVGEEKERAELQDCLVSARSGRGLLICISGEAGIGKTTFVENFLHHESAADCLVGRGKCSEHLAGTGAYLPILEALESLTHSAADAGLVRLLRQLAPWWYVQVFPHADDSLNLSSQTAGSSLERIKRELTEFLREVAEMRPILLFFDDVHWADTSSMDIWTYLFDRCSSSRILILAAYRPEFLLPSGHLFANLKLALQAQDVCREIRLPLLSCDNIASYINQVYPGHQFPPEFAQSIHLMTEGNALFMVDLLAHLRNLGIIVQDLERGFWSLNQSIPREEWGIPDSVNGLIDLRIRMLGEDNRHLLACAAIQGHDFDSAVVAKAMETDQTEVEERLDALDRLHGLIGRARPPRSAHCRPTQQYRFAHVLYRNRLFKSLCPNRKAVLSGAIARALLEIYGDRSVTLASHIALLFEAAFDFVNAAKFFLAAGRQALDVSATREAAISARMGLSQISVMQDTPERAQNELLLQMLLAAALTQLKGYSDQEVRKSFDRAFELCERSEDKIALCLALQGLAGYYLTHPDLNMTLEIAKRCSALAESSEDASLLLARSYLIHCVALSHLGQPVQAAELARRCIQICSSKDRPAVLKSGDFDMGIVAHGQLAWILWLCGYPDQARSSALEVLEAARELNHPYTSAFTLFLVSRVHGYLGDSRSSLEHTQEAISIAVHHGFSLVEGWARALQGWALACIGDPTGGIKEIERSLELLGAAGCRLSCTEFLGHKAMALLRIGGQAPALVAIDDAFKLVRDSGELYYEAELYHCRAVILLNKRSAENRVQAESCLRRGISIARQQGLKGFELRCATTLARLQMEEAQVEDALCELFPIYSWFKEGFGSPDLREAKELLDACPPCIGSAVRI